MSLQIALIRVICAACARIDLKKISGWRLFLGLLFAPPVLALAWAPPRSLADLSDHEYIAVLALNVITAYPDFVFHVALCYLILSRTRFRHLLGFCIVMLAVSLLIYIGLRFYYLHDVNGLGYGATTVLKDGRLTSEGLSYLTGKALLNSLGHIVATCILWVVAVPHYRERKHTGAYE